MIGEYKEPPALKPQGREKLDVMRGLDAIRDHKLNRINNAFRNANFQRMMYTVHKNIGTGKVDSVKGYMKPFGVRSKGYNQDHGNGRRK